ncbi:MAG TPA: hypothetical protein DCP74_02555 [Bacteroidales bacterium]|nr:hypothetical protein [Bacteroidales bacterium]
MKTCIFILATLLFTPMRINAQDVNTEPSGSFEDLRDHQTYRWIHIGSQTWMAQNLNFEVPKGSFCYNLDSAQCKTFGRLYEWSVAQKVCPAGWHLPSDQEWKVLAVSLGDQAGEKLKELGDTHWNGPDAVVRGESGFNARAAGCKSLDPNGRTQFMGLGDFAYFWASSTATPINKGWARYLTSGDDILHPYEEWKVWGYSIRCIKD